MRRRSGILLVLSILCATLVACGYNLIPKQVSVNMTINGDGTYEAELDGRVVSARYLLSEIFGAAGMEDDWINEYVVDEEIKELQKDRKFRSVSYLGDGNYEVSFREVGVLDGENDPLDDFMYMEVAQNEDGTVEFRCTLEGYDKLKASLMEDYEKDKTDMTEEEIAEAERFFKFLPDTYHKAFYGLDWRITVDTDAEVLEHNADSEPWFFGLFGGYEWHVTSPDEPMPYIIIRLDKPSPVAKP